LTSYIIAIGGAVGAGKSSVALLLRNRLAKLLGLEPNSHNSLRLLRSDVLRKQLLDIDPLSHLPGKYYENEQYGRLIYNTLHEVARISVDAGDSILLDATYARRWQRAALEAVVSGAEFQGYWLEASIEERLRRLTIRRNDLSDAGRDFAAEQHIERPINEPQWEGIEVGGIVLDELAEKLAGRICGDKPK
jgi:predicted kinase